MKTKEREEALEIIRGMTKEEIITWLSGDVGMLFRPPSKSQLIFGRHQAAANAIMARHEKNTLEEGVAKEIDSLCVELNNTKDHKQYAAIFEKLKPLRKKWEKWIAESKAIRAEEAKVDALWEAYMKQAERESGR